MSNKDDDKQGDGTQDAATRDEDAAARRERLFTEFDDDEAFEEADRDSDFDAMYTEIEEEEDDLELLEDADDEWGPAEDEDSSSWGEESATDSTRGGEPDLWDSDLNPQGSFDDDPPEERVDSTPLPPLGRRSTVEGIPEQWDDIEDEDEYEEEEERELNISLGMIVVAVFALILLGAGGYGIIEERASLQDEIRRLQADLATSAAPAEVAATRDAAAAASERNTTLQSQVQELSRENRSLQAIIAGLESQLAAQQAAAGATPPESQAAEAPEPPAPAPQPTPEPTQKPAATAQAKPATSAPPEPAPRPADSGSWFVNFSSYSQRGTADNWADKLKPDRGRVVVAAAESNGRTIYRVRVVNLPDKSAAEAVAAQLQGQFKTGKLWVGRSD